MKFDLKKNTITVSILLLLSTPGLQAVRRTVVPAPGSQTDQSLGRNTTPAVVTPLPESVQPIVTVTLSKLVHYSQKVSTKTVEFFDKNSGKTYEQDVTEYQKLLDEIIQISKEIPTGHPVLASLKALSQKLSDTQHRWVSALKARTIKDVVRGADEIALKNKLMADNIFGSVHPATKKRENGIKQKLESAGAVGELELLKQLICNIDTVFNFDGTQVGLNNRYSKAQYLRNHKGFTFSVTFPESSPVRLEDCWNGKTQLL